MILKNLELIGFKSFVDVTRLDFTRGFTAVVGPNGCGKSNISDAIRWVIGEQSSKSLRGTRITDLIFNGSQSRKPFNRAEITMTLSDVPEGLRIANVQNLSEDIKVTRCYHRSGESEFYITASRAFSNSAGACTTSTKTSRNPVGLFLSLAPLSLFISALTPSPNPSNFLRNSLSELSNDDCSEYTSRAD